MLLLAVLLADWTLDDVDAMNEIKVTCGIQPFVIGMYIRLQVVVSCSLQSYM